jgi:hypothetical protein
VHIGNGYPEVLFIVWFKVVYLCLYIYLYTADFGFSRVIISLVFMCYLKRDFATMNVEQVLLNGILLFLSSGLCGEDSTIAPI